MSSTTDASFGFESLDINCTKVHFGHIFDMDTTSKLICILALDGTGRICNYVGEDQHFSELLAYYQFDTQRMVSFIPVEGSDVEVDNVQIFSWTW